VTSSAAVVGVYRARNAERVQRLAGPALDRGWQVAWWALDEVVDDLAPLTVGSGGGPRLALLNRVLERADVRADWVVVSDDDLSFERGDVARLVSLAGRANLDLAQPARSDPRVDHGITAARRLSRARRTSFVEIGPLFVVGPRWRDRVLPFPEERGMGWGLELDWLQLFREGCELGIVDSVRVRHEGERGEDYDDAGEIDRVHAELEALGYRGWSDVQVTLGTWRPWQRSPSWAQGGRSA
jgi:hypothetical protein